MFWYFYYEQYWILLYNMRQSKHQHFGGIMSIGWTCQGYQRPGMVLCSIRTVRYRTGTVLLRYQTHIILLWSNAFFEKHLLFSSSVIQILYFSELEKVHFHSCQQLLYVEILTYFPYATMDFIPAFIFIQNKKMTYVRYGTNSFRVYCFF